MASARSSGIVMVARFMEVFYHISSPVGECGEVGAVGEQ
jgi:hypothetical protein